MQRFFDVFLLLLSVVVVTALASCHYQKTENLRVVSSSGKPVNLEKKVPLFNAQQLKKQKLFKQQNGGITLIDESGPKAFDSKGNNYAYAEKQSSLPESIFADEVKDSSKKVVKKSTPDNKATIKEMNGEGYAGVGEDENIESKNIKISNGVGYLFPGDKTTHSTVRKSQKENSVIALNKPAKGTAISKSSDSSYDSSGTYYLQLGAFKSRKGAEDMLNNYKKVSGGEIKEVTINRQKIYRVVLGPYVTKSTAEANKEKVIKTGHYDVFITKR